MLRFDGRIPIFLTCLSTRKEFSWRMSKRAPLTKDHAFTLVELLVVISIVGLLAGLTVPAVSGALLKGKQAEALNQLKQLGTLALAYATDNNGTVPGEGGEGVQSFSALAQASNATAWYNVLPPLSGFLAASNYRSNPKGFYDKGSLFFSKAAKYPANKTASAYFAFGINSQLNDVKLVALPYPSRTALFGDARLPNETTLPPSGGKMDSLGQPKVRDSRFVSRYNGVGIITFCDGHSEAFRATTQTEILDTNKVIWDPTK
ncbi:MAG: type II secretion system protein [Verrucomicrobia bacterium]|nr:type II secretion system protein [Pseudomonadota bacterium]NBS50671.1 type II secretion system protein [Verrucomicrobiota bacterium]NBS79679.1 type II secretion system protein [bacterium]NBY65475.1 type II secretion system protein [Verrucomicrobiota bacterium]